MIFKVPLYESVFVTLHVLRLTSDTYINRSDQIVGGCVNAVEGRQVDTHSQQKHTMFMIMSDVPPSTSHKPRNIRMKYHKRASKLLPGSSTLSDKYCSYGEA